MSFEDAQRRRPSTSASPEATILSAGGGSTPAFGTPDRGHLKSSSMSPSINIANVRVDGLRAADQPSTSGGGKRYDAADAEDKCRRAAIVVQKARAEIARVRAKFAASRKENGNPYATPKGGQRRQHPDGVPDTPGTCERESKGLRHFSMRVCEVVEDKKETTYNEVANELVEENRKIAEDAKTEFDENNLRRRVYDALNVLTAMEIITKKKKLIFWNGFPEGYVKPDGASRTATTMQTPPTKTLPAQSNPRENYEENEEALEMFERKTNYLAELVDQHDALVALVDRNKKQIAKGGPPPTGIQLPFILLQTKKDANVEIEISDDQRSVHFDFGKTPFQVHDGFHVLTKMIALHKKRIPDPAPRPQQQNQPRTSTPMTTPNGKSPMPTKRKATPTEKRLSTPGRGNGKSPTSAPRVKRTKN